VEDPPRLSARPGAARPRALGGVKKRDLEPAVLSRTTAKFMIVDPILGGAYGVDDPERCGTHCAARANHRYQRYHA
jgi:hypothetical protein